MVFFVVVIIFGMGKNIKKKKKLHEETKCIEKKKRETKIETRTIDAPLMHMQSNKYKCVLKNENPLKNQR